MRISEVYDIETYLNTFIYCSYVIEEDRWYTFVINNDLDQSEDLFQHLTRGGFFHIGYNNLKFDYIVLHHFLINYSRYQYSSGFAIANDLYFKAQQLITSETNEFIRDSDMKILQIDLMSIFHLGYKSKMTSLKDIEFALNMDIEESPIPFDACPSLKDIDDIIKYCKNDVLATFNFYELARGKTDHPVYKGINELKLRSEIKKQFRINCLNYPNVKIGEQLILSLYCRATGKKWAEVKELQTDRSYVDLVDCIPHYCHFENKILNDVLDLIKSKTVNTSLMDFETEVIFHSTKFSLGCGGLHACAKSGIYKSDDKNTILSLDVNSMYPSIAKVCGLYPEHLGKVFNDIYCPFLDARLEEKKKENKNEALIRSFKLILNSVGGKTNEKKSFLLDQLYFLRLTFGGQLFTLMWIEQLVKVCPDIQILMANTDGIEVLVPNSFVDIVLSKCNDLEKEVGFTIDRNIYKQLILKNVNEYIAEYNDSTPEKEHVKLNGCFAIDKEIHRDPSARIIPIALKNYFLYNIPVINTIKESKNIFDFCIRLKVNRTSKAKFTYLEDGWFKHVDLGRTTRYFCSNTGGGLSVFYNGSEKANRLSKDYNFTIFNKYYDSDDYDINYQFYITEANKIKNVVEDMQLNLF